MRSFCLLIVTQDAVTWDEFEKNFYEFHSIKAGPGIPKMELLKAVISKMPLFAIPVHECVCMVDRKHAQPKITKL